MKKILLWIAVIAFTAALFIKPAFAADSLKIGYLDVDKVFKGYKKTSELEGVLEKEAKAKQAERDKYVSEITRLRDELELLSEKGKQDKQAVIDEKVKKLQEFDRSARSTLNKRREDMVTEVVKEIDKVVQDYGQKEGYDLILNDKVIVYKKGGMDVTENILKALNGQYTPGK